MASKKQNYAPSVQKLKRVYCICFGNVPTTPLDPDNTNNQVILILRYYLYKCRCFSDTSSINGGLKYLKYCIKIEKTTIDFLSSPQKQYKCKKWWSFEHALGECSVAKCLFIIN